MTAIVPKHAAKSKVLESISPSSMTQFDETTPFGCERRWWFKYALGNPEPQDPSMLLGEALHFANETYLMTGEEPTGGVTVGKPWSPEQGNKAASLFKLGVHVLKELRGLPFLKVEQTMPEGYEVGGLRVSSRSKCDVVTGYGIIDWKTTSDIDKYGKTPGQLANDTQMLIYARAFHPTAPKVRLIHGQYQTKGRERFQMPAVDVSRQQLDDRYGGYILPLVERMKSTYLVPAAKEVKPNRDACWRCPHKGICPPDKENPLMGAIFAKFQKAVSNPTPSDAPKSEPSKAANPVEPAPGDSPAVQKKLRARDLIKDEEPKTQTTPSEEDEVAAMERKLAEAKAKKAAAEKAAAEAAAKAKAAAEAKAKQEAEAEEVDEADLVEEPETTEVKKRGPGRPPGAKNKATLEKEAQQGTRFTKTTVSFGVTMNLGINVGAVRVDCSHTIEYSDGDADAAFALGLKKAKEQVEAQCQELQAEMEQQNTKK